MRSACECIELKDVERFGTLSWTPEASPYAVVNDLNEFLPAPCFAAAPHQFAKVPHLTHGVLRNLVWHPVTVDYVQVGPTWLGWMEVLRTLGMDDAYSTIPTQGISRNPARLKSKYGAATFILFELIEYGVLNPVSTLCPPLRGREYRVTYIPEINSYNYAPADKFEDCLRATLIGAWDRWLRSQKKKAVEAIWRLVLLSGIEAPISELLSFFKGYGRILTAKPGKVMSLREIAARKAQWEHRLAVTHESFEILPRLGDSESNL